MSYTDEQRDTVVEGILNMTAEENPAMMEAWEDTLRKANARQLVEWASMYDVEVPCPACDGHGTQENPNTGRDHTCGGCMGHRDVDPDRALHMANELAA